MKVAAFCAMLENTRQEQVFSIAANALTVSKVSTRQASACPALLNANGASLARIRPDWGAQLARCVPWASTGCLQDLWLRKIARSAPQAHIRQAAA